MTISDNLREAFDSTPSYLTDFLPEGRYVARAHSVKLISSRSGSSGLAVGLQVTRGRAQGHLLYVTLWLVGGALPRAKGTLECLGLGSLNLDATLAFNGFASLPEAYAYVEHEVSQGQARQAITVMPMQFGSASQDSQS